MNKVFTGALIFFSLSIHGHSLECGLFESKNDNVPNVTMSVDLSPDRIYETRVSDDRSASMSFTGFNGEEGEYKIGIYRSNEYDYVSLDSDIVLNMKSGKSFRVVSNGELDNNMTVICYKDEAPF